MCVHLSFFLSLSLFVCVCVRKNVHIDREKNTF